MFLWDCLNSGQTRVGRNRGFVEDLGGRGGWASRGNRLRVVEIGNSRHWEIEDWWVGVIENFRVEGVENYKYYDLEVW